MQLKTLVCPMSFERIDKNVVRITAILTAVIIALYAGLSLASEITSFAFMLAIAIDYVIRVFTPFRFGPIGWVGTQIANRFNMTPDPMDKAPKMFAVRVGLIFAIASVSLFFVSPVSAVGVGLGLMAFNLLDGVLDVCVGCYTYTYVVLPIMGEQ